MKVVLDVSAVPAHAAGAGRYVIELARRLPNVADTTLVARRGNTARWHHEAPGARVETLVPNGRVARLAYEALALGTSEVARSADLWHAPHYTMPRRRSRPTVVTIHDLTFFTNPEWHERAKVVFFQRAIRYSAAHADVLIAVSEFTARQLNEVSPDHAPLVVAPLGVDLEHFSPDDATTVVADAELFAQHGLPRATPFIAFVGTAEPRKGIDVLLDAFCEVAALDDTVELWLAGQSGWSVDDLERRLAHHPFVDRIRRLGFVDDALVVAMFRRAAAVAYPSRGEGFGLPVLEALACGALVVTTGDTVMAEVAGTCALLVPAGDAPALAVALGELLAVDVPARAQRALEARARAEAFTWEACVARHLEAYERAIAR